MLRDLKDPMKAQKQLAVEWYITGMNEDIRVNIYQKSYELNSDEFYSECLNQVQEQKAPYETNK